LSFCNFAIDITVPFITTLAPTLQKLVAESSTAAKPTKSTVRANEEGDMLAAHCEPDENMS